TSYGGTTPGAPKRQDQTTHRRLSDGTCCDSRIPAGVRLEKKQSPLARSPALSWFPDFLPAPVAEYRGNARASQRSTANSRLANELAHRRPAAGDYAGTDA